MYNFSNYRYPFYRSFSMGPAYQQPYYSPYYSPYYNPYYGPINTVNAFQSQLADQTITNTGIAANVNQTASPVTIY